MFCMFYRFQCKLLYAHANVLTVVGGEMSELDKRPLIGRPKIRGPALRLNRQPSIWNRALCKDGINPQEISLTCGLYSTRW